MVIQDNRPYEETILLVIKERFYFVTLREPQADYMTIRLPRIEIIFPMKRGNDHA